MIEDIRTYARLQLAVAEHPGPITGMILTREQYIQLVLAYAVEHHGDGQETKMMAERTARHLWASKR